MANQVTTKDRVDYLVKRRFPLSYLLNIPPSLSGRGHDVSPELIEAVERRGVQVADWKSLYEQAVAALKGEQKSTSDRLQIGKSCSIKRKPLWIVTTLLGSK